MTDPIAALEDPSPEMVQDLAVLLLNSAHRGSSVSAEAHDICQHLGDYLRNEARGAAQEEKLGPYPEPWAWHRHKTSAQKNQKPSAEVLAGAETGEAQYGGASAEAHAAALAIPDIKPWLVIPVALALDAFRTIKMWQPIETAPKDGTWILACRKGWPMPALLRWKTNPRTKESYFGDPVEMDDYDLADMDSATHWLPVPPFA